MSKMTILNVTDWARFVEATNAKLRKNFKAFEIETKDIKDMVSLSPLNLHRFITDQQCVFIRD